MGGGVSFGWGQPRQHDAETYTCDPLPANFEDVGRAFRLIHGVPLLSIRDTRQWPLCLKVVVSIACELIKEDSGQWRFSRRTVFHDHDYTLDGIGR